MLPYVEQEPLAKQFDPTAGWDAGPNAAPGRQRLRVVQCKAWTSYEVAGAESLTTYVGVAGVGPGAATLPPKHPAAGVFGYDRRTRPADVTDGLSNTILLWETARDNGPWARGGPATVRGLDPGDTPYAGSGRPFGGLHFAERAVFLSGSSTGSSLAMADCSVRWVSNAVSADVFNGLATIAGNEPPSLDW